jgi:hypothetical protein
MSYLTGSTVRRVREILSVLVLFVCVAAVAGGGAAGTGTGSASNTIRVNSGGGAYTDSSGNGWSADCCHTTGGHVFTTTAAIAGTGDPALYQSLYWNNGPFSYSFPQLPAGSYQVTLKFAELANLNGTQRQFNVAINGTQVLTNFDVTKAAGGVNRAIDETFPATVGSSGLTINFTQGAANYPIVNAIQVTPSATTSSTPTPPPPSSPPPSSAPRDTQAPSTPTGLSVGSVTASSVSLSWPASTDNVGVAGYDIYRNGTGIDTVTSTSDTVVGLACGSSYTFGVDAFDAAGNVSSIKTVTASTGACSASSDSSGVPMPVGDTTVNGQTWHQVFADNFPSGENVALRSSCAGETSLNSRWNEYPYPWNGTPSWATYCPERTTSIHDGVLDFWIHSEQVGGVWKHLITALSPKIPGQLYGRYVIRFEEPTAFPDYHMSFLLWPNSNVWPRDGEIDLPEGDTNGTIWAFMHRQGATSGGDQDAYGSGVSVGGSGWHTAVIEWLPSRCTFLVDGKVIGQSTSRIPNTPMHWELQMNGNGTAASAVSNSAGGHILIDWVAVYSPA